MSKHDGMTEAEVVHQMKNHLGIVISYAELLIDSTPVEDPLRADLITIRQAARDAFGLISHLVAK
jgi:hypothetical protein